MGICKDCRHFQSRNYHISIDPKEGEQPSGHCKLLVALLKIDNDDLFLTDKLVVWHNFGCSLFSPKDT